MLNVVNLHGRLTAKPELKTTNNGAKVTTFTVAVARPGKDAGTDFIRCTAWQDRAERICKYFDKGQEIVLKAHLATRAVKNAETNKTHYSLDVVVDEIDFCGSKTNSDKPSEEPEFPEPDVELEPYE